MVGKRILIPVEFIKPVFLKDRSVRLEFETGELDGEDVATLSDSRNTLGWLLYAETEDQLKVDDIPEGQPDPDLQKKSASQRLRNVLYVFWEQRGSKGRWEDFYEQNMNRLIDTVKDKLEPRL